MTVIAIHERDPIRANVIITQPMQPSPAWDCDNYDELREFSTFNHKYFVIYTNVNTNTGKAYPKLAHMWNCKGDGLPTRHNVGRWMIGHTRQLASAGASHVQVMSAAVYNSKTRELVATC